LVFGIIKIGFCGKKLPEGSKLRSTRCLACFLFLILTFLTASTDLRAAVVTVDPATKSGSSDVDTLEVKAVRVAGDQVGFFVQSLSESPQKLVAKVNDLKDQDYDVYINGSFIGVKSGKLLMEQGLELDIPGSVTDPDKMRCLRALEPRVRPEYERIRTDRQPEVMRVAFMFNQVVDFIASGIRNDRTYRSATVILAPSGKMLQKMIFMTRNDAETTAMAATRACWLIQKARDRIYDVIKDPVLRNTSLITLTPVDFSAVLSKVNGKVVVKAIIVNNCDLPISGNLSFDPPKGWKHNAKSLSFDGLKSGKSTTLSFELIPPTKNAAPPESIPVAANVRVVQDPFVAEVKFKTTAKAAE